MNINKLSLKEITLLLVLGVGGIALPLTAAEALSTATAQALVQETSEHMLQTLRKQQKELERNPERIYPLVKDIVLPHFDFQRMAQLALGKHWRQATLEQRQRFVDEFRMLLVRTYSTALLKYANEKIHYLPVRGSSEANDTTIGMEIHQRDGSPPVPMSLRLYERQGAWKVFDVKVDGISLVANYRTSFANEIRKGGIDTLIDTLARKNNKVGA
jgi:phospholipid transport system substrate-binding protein